MTKRVIFPTGPDALQRERLHVAPEIWEDGLRIDPQPGNFEWWYFDAHFDDGSTAVLNFPHRKNVVTCGPAGRGFAAIYAPMSLMLGLKGWRPS